MRVSSLCLSETILFVYRSFKRWLIVRMTCSQSRSTRLRISCSLREGKMHDQWRLREERMLSSSKFAAPSISTPSACLTLRRRISWSNLFLQVRFVICICLPSTFMRLILILIYWYLWSLEREDNLKNYWLPIYCFIGCESIILIEIIYMNKLTV